MRSVRKIAALLMLAAFLRFAPPRSRADQRGQAAILATGAGIALALRKSRRDGRVRYNRVAMGLLMLWISGWLVIAWLGPGPIPLRRTLSLSAIARGGDRLHHRFGGMANWRMR